MTRVKPRPLYHVAFWVGDLGCDSPDYPQRIGLGMHVIDRQDKFTLVGSESRRGKLTLFEAEGPR